MLMVDRTMVGVYASKLDAMTELGLLIRAMANKGMIDKDEALMIVEVAFMDKEELKKMAETIMKELDTDGSGTLEIEEVVKGCTARPKLLKIFSSI